MSGKMIHTYWKNDSYMSGKMIHIYHVKRGLRFQTFWHQMQSIGIRHGHYRQPVRKQWKFMHFLQGARRAEIPIDCTIR